MGRASPPPGPIRTHSGRKQPMRMADSGKKEGNIQNLATSQPVRPDSGTRTKVLQNAENTQSNESLPRLKSRAVNSASKLGQNSAGLASKIQSGDVKGKNSILRDTRQPTLEAVVTLSKGTVGDTTDVHVIPSPPTSAKPATSRPSSAQRFRNMVLDCRDAK